MMKYAGLSLILALAAPAGAAGIIYDCDTAADHYSELALPAGAAAFSVSGNVRLNQTAPSKKFVPLTRVQVASAFTPGQAPVSYAGFTLSTLPADARKTPSGASVVQMLSYEAAGKDDDIVLESMLDKPGEVQHFTLAYDGSNLSLKIGSRSKTIPLRVTDPIVRIICSTGEFLFTDLIITPSR